jgi:hypothetical protein
LDVVYYEVDVGDDLLLSFDSFPDWLNLELGVTRVSIK